MVASLRNLCRQWKFFVFFTMPVALSWIPVLWPTASGKAGYIFLLTCVFQITEVVPIPATVFLSLFLMTATGVQTTMESAKNFGSDILFLFMSLFIFAVSIEETNLHSRLALLTIRTIGMSPSRLILGVLTISAFLSMWMSNTAVALMIIPIANALSDNTCTFSTLEPEQELKGILSVEEQSEATDSVELTLGGKTDVRLLKNKEVKLRKALQLCTVYGSNIGGLATLVGSYPNLLFRNLLEKLYGPDASVSFLSFLLVCGPVMICALFLSWVTLSTLFIPGWLRFWKARPNAGQEARRKVIEQKIKALGSMRHSEITVVVIFLLVVALWLSRDPKFAPGWGSLVKRGFATDSVPALAAATLFFILPSDYNEFGKGKLCPILEWQKVVTKFPWGLFMYSGHLTVLASLANTSRLITCIGNAFPDISDIPPIVAAALVCIFVSALSEVMNNVVVLSIFVPLLADVAEKMAVNPTYFTLAATIACQLTFMVPIGSPSSMLIYGSEGVELQDMMKAGVLVKIGSILCLICSLELLGSLAFDANTFPSWAVNRMSVRLSQFNATST